MAEPDLFPLQVDDLHVDFATRHGAITAVDGVSFHVQRGHVLAIVGESGSGKSVTSRTCLGLVDDNATTRGSILVEGQDMLSLPEHERNKLRGQTISMVFQDALAALNPFATVGRQVADAYRVHHPGANRRQTRARAIEALAMVGVPEPAERAAQFPHEFSGGMRQRVMIAMAIVNEPTVLIADEPTTALDVTVQAQVLQVLDDLRERMGMAMVLVTHDLGVVAQIADEVAVMYCGHFVEKGTVFDIFDHPSHPYTLGLLNSTPDPDAGSKRLRSIPGVPASATSRPSGCPFHPRCAYQAEVGERCLVERPELTARRGSDDHQAACHLGPDRKLP